MERISTLLTTVTYACAVALLVILLVGFMPFGWATLAHAKVGAMLLLGSIGLLSMIAVMCIRGVFAVPRSVIFAAALLLPVVYTISALVSSTGSGALIGVGVERDTVAAVLLWVVVLALAALAVGTKQQVLNVYRILFGSALIVGVFEILRIFIGSVVSLGTYVALPAASIVGGWHDLAILMGLVALMSGLLWKHRLVGTWLSMATLIVSIITLVLVNAQDVWMVLGIAALGGLGYMLWVVREGTIIERIKREGSIVLMVIVLLSGFMYVFGTRIHDALPQPIQVIEVEVRPSWEGTFSVASNVYREQGFLFGSGPNTFTRQWGLYKPAGVNETAFWNVDFAQGVGFIPTSLITAGLIAGLVWLLFLGALLYRVGRTLMTGMYIAPPALLFAASGGLLYLWVFNVIYAPGVAIIGLTFFMTGVYIAFQRAWGIIPMIRSVFSRSTTQGIATIVAVVVIVGIIGVHTISLGRALASNMQVNRGVAYYNKTSDRVTAESMMESALTLNPNSGRARRALVELGLLHLQELSRSGDAASAEEIQAVLQGTIQNALSAVSINETDYQSWLVLARVYQELAGAQVEGAYENAEEAYRRAIEANPSNPEPYVRLAQAALLQEDTAAARDALNQALARKNNYAIAHFLLSQIEVAEGNTEAAIIASENAVRGAPEEPLAWFRLGALYFSIEEYERAAGSLEQAVVRNSNYANALYLLALSYRELGRFENALVILNQVAALNPNNTTVTDLVDDIRADLDARGTQAPGNEEVGETPETQ